MTKYQPRQVVNFLLQRAVLVQDEDLHNTITHLDTPSVDRVNLQKIVAHPAFADLPTISYVVGSDGFNGVLVKLPNQAWPIYVRQAYSQTADIIRCLRAIKEGLGHHNIADEILAPDLEADQQLLQLLVKVAHTEGVKHEEAPRVERTQAVDTNWAWSHHGTTMQRFTSGMVIIGGVFVTAVVIELLAILAFATAPALIALIAYLIALVWFYTNIGRLINSLKRVSDAVLAFFWPAAKDGNILTRAGRVVKAGFTAIGNGVKAAGNSIVNGFKRLFGKKDPVLAA